MLLAGLTTTATRSKKNARTLADTKLEMEVISQCGSGVLDDYKPSRINMARMKLEGQLGVVEYSRITVPDSAHMGDPARDVEMLKARNSARGHLMAKNEKQAMQEYWKELTENSNLNPKEYGTVMSSEANEIGLEKLLENFWRGPSKDTSTRRCMHLRQWHHNWPIRVQELTCRYDWPGV